MSFKFSPLRIPEVILVEVKTYPDERGFFMETYRRDAFAANGITDDFVQDNFSHSRRGVLRGLHYQMHPQAQSKLVRVVYGEVFDVAVDIRKGSPTFGQWVGAALSAENHRMLYVPAGFAHGFCVLGEAAGLAYKVTADYAPDLEAGIVWNDPDIGVAWPVAEPVLATKDAALPGLHDADNNFVYEER